MKKLLCVLLVFLLLSSVLVFTSLADGSIEYVVAFGDVSTANYRARVEWLENNAEAGFDMIRDGNTFYSPAGVEVSGAPNYVQIHLDFHDSYTFGAGGYTLRFEIRIQYREGSLSHAPNFTGCSAMFSDGTFVQFSNVETIMDGPYWVYYLYTDPFSVSKPASLVSVDYLFHYSKPQYGGGYTFVLIDPQILGYTDNPAVVPNFTPPSIDGFGDYESANDAMDAWVDDNKNITDDLFGFDIGAIPNLANSLGFLTLLLESYVFGIEPVTLILRLSIAVGLVGLLFNLAMYPFSHSSGRSAAAERSNARSAEKGKGNGKG